jgi:hypothetical protein
MPQDKESGAKASRYGLDCGMRIIEAIGAERVKRGSNECSLDGELLSVHCARKKTDRVGVTYKTLARLSAVLGAFEQEDGSYLVWRLPRDQYEKLMTNTRSLGPSKNRVGMVKQIDFERYGTRFAKVPISPGLV